MSRRTRNRGLCAYCGVAPGDTNGHVFSRALFATPKPANLVTVPSCKPCNQNLSRYEERFKVMLGLKAAGWSERGSQFLRAEGFRSLRHNQRLLRELQNGFQPVYREIKDGPQATGFSAIPWDAESHDFVMEQITRGLYYHHYGEALGLDVRVKVGYHHNLTQEMLDVTSEFNQERVGDGQIVYRYIRAEDSPLHSVWVYEFYGAHWASAQTKPKSDGG